MESASLFPGNLTREEGDKAASLSGASSTNEVTLSAGRFLVAGWPCKRGKVEPSKFQPSTLLILADTWTCFIKAQVLPGVMSKFSNRQGRMASRWRHPTSGNKNKPSSCFLQRSLIMSSTWWVADHVAAGRDGLHPHLITTFLSVSTCSILLHVSSVVRSG